MPPPSFDAVDRARSRLMSAVGWHIFGQGGPGVYALTMSCVYVRPTYWRTGESGWRKMTALLRRGDNVGQLVLQALLVFGNEVRHMILSVVRGRVSVTSLTMIVDSKLDRIEDMGFTCFALETRERREHPGHL